MVKGESKEGDNLLFVDAYRFGIFTNTSSFLIIDGVPPAEEILRERFLVGERLVEPEGSFHVRRKVVPRALWAIT